MIHLNSDIRLTDELERQLMQEAIAEQARFKPGASLKKMFVKLTQSNKAGNVKAVATRQAKHA